MDVLKQIREMGHQVRKVEPTCFRVQGRVDLWLPSTRSRGKWTWCDRVTGKRGRKPADQVPALIQHILGAKTDAN